MAQYETYGSVRGCCGHRHSSIRTAVACIERDRSGCAAQGGCTDRYVRRTDGVPLTEDEERLVDHFEEG